MYGGTGGNKHLWSNNFRHVKLKIIHNVSFITGFLRQIQVGRGGLERSSKLFPSSPPISKQRMSAGVCELIWSQSTDLRLCLPGLVFLFAHFGRSLDWESRVEQMGVAVVALQGWVGRDTYYLTCVILVGFLNPLPRECFLHFCLFPFFWASLWKEVHAFVCLLFVFIWLGPVLIATLQHLSLWHANPYLPHVGSSSLTRNPEPRLLALSVESSQ